jgi:hypothetical protein
MKTIRVILTLAISGTAISAAYTSAYAGNMKGTPVCSDGMNCFSHKSKVATATAKGHVKPPKMGN